MWSYILVHKNIQKQTQQMKTPWLSPTTSTQLLSFGTSHNDSIYDIKTYMFMTYSLYMASHTVL